MPKPSPSRCEQDHHRRAFELYYAQGAKRSFAKAAAELGVSVSSLKTWSAAFGWKKRLGERDATAARQIADRVLQEGIADTSRHLKIVRAALLKLAKGIVDGTIKPRIDDLPKLIQLEQDLVEGPSPDGDAPRVNARSSVVIYLPDNGRDPVPESRRGPAPPTIEDGVADE